MHPHTNRLVNETSPYLLQHAHNPVDWYPWGDEALQKARSEDKPILVSIGYAACHWCHVMERESFEDTETATLMNEHFINIKIDREERPDLDHIYMDAVQAMAGSGGWPLNVFLMPDGKPFYGGTYFPPRRAFNRPSWKEILEGVHQAYTERKHELESQAENLTAHLANANAFGVTASKEHFTDADIHLIAENIMKQADKELGGFGAAPKFPQTFSIQYLLRHYHYTRDEACLRQALNSLDKMIYGGIYDQLGGGFARYSTDAEWLAPHFEKMLYDNALLVSVLAEAYQLTKNELYSETIHQTILFVERELMSDQGGFFSALDADSEGVEGRFYVWSLEEIQEVLGDDALVFSAFYDVSEKGNWEHANILRIKKPLEQFAAESGAHIGELKQQLANARQKLLAAREKRTRPALDDKILLGWNALMNIALTKAYAATLNDRYRQSAIRNMAFLEQHLRRDGTWHHTYKNGTAKIPAFLDDLAYLAAAYIQLQEVTGNAEYLLKARLLAQTIIDGYSDETGTMFYYTDQSQSDVIVRKKEIYDGATPSGNGMMAFNLSYLAKVFDQPAWEERAQSMGTSLKSVIIRYPTSFGLWAQQAQQMVYGMEEIAITGKDAARYLSELLPFYLPGKLLQSAVKGDEKFPLLRGRTTGETLIYHCKNYVCLQPFKTVEEFLLSLGK
jgi:uncharacterized protein YyaL (SSP411 family)